MENTRKSKISLATGMQVALFALSLVAIGMLYWETNRIISELTTQLGYKEVELSVAQERAASLEGAKEELSQLKGAAETRVTQLSKELSELKKEREQSEGAAQLAAAARNAAETKIAQLSRELSDLERELKREKEVLKNETSKLRSELSSQIVKYVEMEALKKKLAAQLSEKADALESANRDNSILRAKGTALENRVEDLSSQLYAARDEVEQVRCEADMTEQGRKALLERSLLKRLLNKE